jgi:hypothetical protein
LTPPHASSRTVGQVLSIVHDPPSLFVLAPSYRAWFETLVERYESGQNVRTHAIRLFEDNVEYH